MPERVSEKITFGRCITIRLPDYFLTSDDPCQLDDKTQDVVMPLALDVAIVGRIVADGESSHLRHCDVSPEIIKKINQGVVRRCKSLVYSHHESKELRRFVMKHHVMPDVMQVGRSFSNNPKPMSGEDIERLMKRFNELRRRERES